MQNYVDSLFVSYIKVTAREEIDMKLIPQTDPALLCDVLFMKCNRGDADAETFKRVACFEFDHKLNSTIKGAAHTMRQLVNNRRDPDSRHVAVVNFLSDLEAVIAGDRNGWIAPHERAA